MFDCKQEACNTGILVTASMNIREEQEACNTGNYKYEAQGGGHGSMATDYSSHQNPNGLLDRQIYQRSKIRLDWSIPGGMVTRVN